jgi:hypothetical protein
MCWSGEESWERKVRRCCCIISVCRESGCEKNCELDGRRVGRAVIGERRDMVGD